MILAIVMLVALAVPVTASSDDVDTAEEEVEKVQEAGQAFIEELAGMDPNYKGWEDARAGEAQPCYDIQGEVNAYLFQVEKGKKAVGRVVVGNSVYEYTVLEASHGVLPPDPTQRELKTILDKDLGLTAVDMEEVEGPKRLVYIGWGEFFAMYDIKGQDIGVHLFLEKAAPLSDLPYYLGSPEGFRAAKQGTKGANHHPRTEVKFWLRDMNVWNDCDHDPEEHCWCGPCSGTSIGQYYRTRTEGGPKYENLYSDENTMFDRLYYLMETDEWPEGAVYPPEDYGDGFVDYTEERGYSNFSWYKIDSDSNVTPEDYWEAVDDLNNGWPLPWLMFWEFHWRGIKGYWYGADFNYILATDSAEDDETWYYWPGGTPGAHVLCIKD